MIKRKKAIDGITLNPFREGFLQLELQEVGLVSLFWLHVSRKVESKLVSVEILRFCQLQTVVFVNFTWKTQGIISVHGNVSA